MPLTLTDGNPDTVVQGLMAVGEAACVSVHGANRLGSNSLIDLVVFGKAAGSAGGEVAAKASPAITNCPRTPATRRWRASTDFRNAKGGTPTARMRFAMQKAMQEDAAVFRTGETLAKGQKRIDEIYAQRSDIRVSDRSHDLEHRSGRDAGVRQSDPAGGGDGRRRGRTARKAAAPMPARISPTATTRTG